MIHDDFDVMDASLSQMLLLHDTLLSHSQSPNRRKLKEVDDAITKIRREGTRQIVYVPISHQDTLAAMEQLELAKLLDEGKIGKVGMAKVASYYWKG